MPRLLIAAVLFVIVTHASAQSPQNSLRDCEILR